MDMNMVVVFYSELEDPLCRHPFSIGTDQPLIWYTIGVVVGLIGLMFCRTRNVSKLVCLVVIVNYNTDSDSFIWYSRLARRFEIVPTDTDKIDFFLGTGQHPLQHYLDSMVLEALWIIFRTEQEPFGAHRIHTWNNQPPH